MLWLLPLAQAYKASLCWLRAVVSPLHSQGRGGRRGPGEVLAAAVLNAVRQAGAGCSRSHPVGASTVRTALA